MNTNENNPQIFARCNEDIIQDLKRVIDEKEKSISTLRMSLDMQLQRIHQYEKMARKAQDDLFHYKSLNLYELAVLKWKKRHK